jgi:hypothetical protein
MPIVAVMAKANTEPEAEASKPKSMISSSELLAWLHLELIQPAEPKMPSAQPMCDAAKHLNLP